MGRHPCACVLGFALLTANLRSISEKTVNVVSVGWVEHRDTHRGNRGRLDGLCELGFSWGRFLGFLIPPTRFGALAGREVHQYAAAPLDVIEHRYPAACKFARGLLRANAEGVALRRRRRCGRVGGGRKKGIAPTSTAPSQTTARGLSHRLRILSPQLFPVVGKHCARTCCAMRGDERPAPLKCMRSTAPR